MHIYKNLSIATITNAASPITVPAAAVVVVVVVVVVMVVVGAE
jgi:hypothetical protein